MKKYIHIGYPKNFSTSLQRDFFSRNKEIFHLGIGLNNNLGYYDNIINKTFEVYLKTCKTLFYEWKRSEISNHFDVLFRKALSKGYKACGVSSEHLSFAFTYDGLSADVKAERLADIIGIDSQIIMIIRNQLDLIKSLYRESVRVGFKGDFKAYIYYLYKYQDRNYISDLHYDWVYDIYSNIFGPDKVHVLFFEDYRNDNGALKFDLNSKQPCLFLDLNSILEVATNFSGFGHYNEALNKNEIIKKVELNYKYSHDLGNHMYDAAEKHRLEKYLIDDLNFSETEAEIYSDVLKKRNLIERSRAKLKSNSKANLYACDTNIMNKLLEKFSLSNGALEKKLSKNLPSGYHNISI